MSILIQEREDILLNNNTAQQRFEEILAETDKETPILFISTVLYGDLDLSVMKSDKYKHIEEIVFSEGKITSVVHVPTTIKKLVIPKNILLSLDELPISLKVLDICENNIKLLDLSYLKNLETLKCSDNRMEELVLPKDLKELHVENNDIKYLNARDFPTLKILNIENNSLLIIDNFEILILDTFETKNNPLLTSGRSTQIEEDKETEKRIDYIECLNKYFQLKSIYDTDDKKRCIKCKRKCGTHFSNADYYYTATCGNTSDPCKLNIKLYRGQFKDNITLVNSMKVAIEEDKESIIRQKMDTIFSYISEAESAKQFQNKVESYTENSELYKMALQEYNDIVNSFEKKKKINDKTNTYYETKRSQKKMLEDYEENNNKRLLKDAMELYVDTLQPCAEMIQKLNYPLMEVNTIDSVYELHQYELLNSDREISVEEPPKVEKFVI